MECEYFERSSEEDEKLKKSTKRANTREHARGVSSPGDWSGAEKGRQKSYKDKLAGSIPSAYA